MEVKNKTIEVQIQEARREGFENALVVKDSGNSYSNGLAITKVLYQLREQIAQELEQIASENDTEIIPLSIALAVVRGRK